MHDITKKHLLRPQSGKVQVLLAGLDGGVGVPTDMYFFVALGVLLAGAFALFVLYHLGLMYGYNVFVYPAYLLIYSALWIVAVPMTIICVIFWFLSKEVANSIKKRR